jgi:hypothetical protein
MRTERMADMSAGTISRGSLAIALSCRQHKTVRRIDAAKHLPTRTPQATGGCDSAQPTKE